MTAASEGILAPLGLLGNLAKGPVPYFVELTKSSDPYLVVGGWKGLLDGGHLTGHPLLWEGLIPVCVHSAIWHRAFDFFETQVLEHDLAARVAQIRPSPLAAARTEWMRAKLAFDPVNGERAAGDAYLASGDFNWVIEAHSEAEDAGGWTYSMPWNLRAVLLDPQNAKRFSGFIGVLDQSGQAPLLRDCANILSARGVYPAVVEVILAAAETYEGMLDQAITRLDRLEKSPAFSDARFTPFCSQVFHLRALAEEKTGRFEAAYRHFVAMNASDRPADVDPQNVYRSLAAKKNLRVPPLPPDKRTDVIQMLGFPRSGTTLLENTLAAHPSIETFEEIPAYKAATDILETHLLDGPLTPATIGEGCLKAREKYYEEIDIRRRKPSATVFVDKLPLRSTDADFLRRLFPDWRYVFSIRHPFDVVLSCFKQRFAPNPAMENFRTIELAVRLYDTAMTEWFAVHTLDDPNVHYVRYDDLVTDFDKSTGEVLKFLGLEWNDSVRDFASAAEKRGARTPSYQKVRQGIGIGIQTYWRNYRFVFETQAAQPLRKWVDFFGYES